ncbi:MAG TPA: UvrB/UvrC motif-containing protein [Chitinivibrionales bacterium]|jgi:protein arginine kinase activator|nr:UvrB/UvrC motif-containing protein [Chitinivibrionales bacterium]
MTPCEQCHSSPATVHIAQISNNVTTVFHLCETCARSKGIMVEVRQEGVLREIGPEHQQVRAAPLSEQEDDRECGHCHTKLSEFKATGRLGCPACYKEFEKDIESVRAKEHRGKRYAARGAALMAGADLEKLRRELTDAIAREEFELAALLRDTIRELQTSAPGGTE